MTHLFLTKRSKPRRRQFRKRSVSPVESERNPSASRGSSGNKSDDSWSRHRSSSPRQSFPKRRQQRELPRYDVRNVINRKRAAKKPGGSRKSRSRSRSQSPRSRSPRSRSPRSSPRRRNRRSSKSPAFGSGNLAQLARRRKSRSRSVFTGNFTNGRV